MSVWKSDEKLLIFTSLISPAKILILSEKQYQAFDTDSTPDETPRKSSKILRCASRIFNSLLGVSSDDETQRLMLDGAIFV